MNVTQPFDLWQVSNELIGDTWLLVVLGLFAIWYLALKGKIGYKVATMFTMVWLSIIFAKTKILILWIVVILVVGLIFYFQQSRAIRRG